MFHFGQTHITYTHIGMCVYVCQEQTYTSVVADNVRSIYGTTVKHTHTHVGGAKGCVCLYED